MYHWQESFDVLKNSYPSSGMLGLRFFSGETLSIRRIQYNSNCAKKVDKTFEKFDFGYRC